MVCSCCLWVRYGSPCECCESRSFGGPCMVLPSIVYGCPLDTDQVSQGGDIIAACILPAYMWFSQKLMLSCFRRSQCNWLSLDRSTDMVRMSYLVDV